jgi:hypothetical protein
MSWTSIICALILVISISLIYKRVLLYGCSIILMQHVTVAVMNFYQNKVHYWFWSIAPQISIIYEGLPILNLFVLLICLVLCFQGSCFIVHLDWLNICLFTYLFITNKIKRKGMTSTQKQEIMHFLYDIERIIFCFIHSFSDCRTLKQMKLTAWQFIFYHAWPRIIL